MARGQMASICRFRANPEGKDRAASCRPPSVLAPGSALGSCGHGALSSARAIGHRSPARRHGQSSGPRGQAADRLSSRAALLVGNPGGGRVPPRSFLNWICSSIDPATSSLFRCSLSPPRLWSAGAPVRPPRPCARRRRRRSRGTASAGVEEGGRSWYSRRGRRRALGRADGGGGWRPSRRAYSPSGAFASEKVLPVVS